MPAPSSAHAARLIPLMTLDEKLAQLGAVWGRAVVNDGQVLEDRALALIAHGIGHVTRPSMLLDPRTMRANAQALQHWLVTRTRLGIPAIIHEEGCAGFMAQGATAFPMPIALASTFAPNLIERMGQVIARQMRLVGAHQVLAPVLDVVRDHRWGRVEETFGEDPVVVASMGRAYIAGARRGEEATSAGSNGAETGVICTAKHFVGYAAGEGGLNWAPAAIGPRQLRDIHVPPFSAAIAAGGANLSVMNAYQEIDGVPCGASREILTDLLREELGFGGTVVSDYDTLSSLHQYHNAAADRVQAAIQALKAGVDVELPEYDLFAADLREAVLAGEIGIDLIDAAVGRVIAQKEALGLFENPYPTSAIPAAGLSRPADRDLSREAAAKGIVLLKNEHDLLPLIPGAGRLALIGPGADSRRLLLGDYHYPAFYEFQFGGMPDYPGDASRTTPPRDAVFALPLAAADLPGAGETTIARPDWDAHLPPGKTLRRAVAERLGDPDAVLYHPGCSIRDESLEGIAPAVALAQAADTVILVLGGRSGLARDCTDGEFNDRVDLTLPGVQQNLLEQVVATGKPVVLVLLNGRPLALPWAAEHASAIIEAWLPGPEGGEALADVLFGAVNPAGRLPVSLARHVGQMPLYYNRKPSAGRSQVFGDYTDLPATPLYPFGHGLSYTRFSYGELTLESAEFATDEVVRAAVTVCNSGDREGEEVVQLYATDPAGSVTRPVLELKAFVRLALAPGESRRIKFMLPPASFAFHGRDGQRAVEPGDIHLKVGASSADIRAEARFAHVGPAYPVSLRDASLGQAVVPDP